MKINIKYSETEYSKELVDVYNVRSKSYSQSLYYYYIAIFIGLLLLVLSFAELNMIAVTITAFISASLITWGALHFYAYYSEIKKNRIYANEQNSPAEYFLSPEIIISIRENIRQEINWSLFKKYTFLNNYIFLYASNSIFDSLYINLKKLSQEERSELGRFIEQRFAVK